MPFDPDNPPSKVKDLPAKKQRKWVEVFNKCWKDKHDDGACHQLAWGVVKKSSDNGCGCPGDIIGPAESEGSIADATQYRDIMVRASTDQCVAREIVLIARELAETNPRLAMSLVQEAKAIRLKAKLMEFFTEAKRFKGEINELMEAMTSSVKDPRALAACPELRDVLELARVMNQGVLRAAHLPESEIAAKMQKVVAIDAG